MYYNKLLEKARIPMTDLDRRELCYIPFRVTHETSATTMRVHTFVQLRPMKVDIAAISSLATKAHRDTRCMINGTCECLNTFSSFVSHLRLIFVELCNFESVQLHAHSNTILFFDEDESI